MKRYTVQNADNKQTQYHGRMAVIIAADYKELTEKAHAMGWNNWNTLKAENIHDNVCVYVDSGYECSAIYNCCDCGGQGCGCRGCFSCNACEYCLNGK